MDRVPLEQRFRSRFRAGDVAECWEWLGSLSRAGYGVLSAGGRKGPNLYAHRVSWKLHFGPPGELHVCHRCDNRRCVNPHHLFLGKHEDNMRDMLEKGRHSRGERHPGAKLTDESVGTIRSAYAAGGVSQYALARDFGVTRSCIAHVLHRSTWAEVGCR